MRKIFLLLTCFFITSMALNAAEIQSAGVKGNWNDASTWVGGVIPGAADNVIIASGDSVFMNLSNMEVNNITIGQNDNVKTVFIIASDADYSFTVHGNMNVNGDSSYFIQQANSAAPRNSVMNLYGDLISTGTIDFKTGSSPNNGFLKVAFVGTTTCTVKVKPFVTTPSTVNEWASIVINKTGGARVILQSDIGMSNVSSAVLTLTSGVVETGDYSLNVYGTGSGSVAGGSQESYIYGKCGRGWPSSNGASNKLFPVGDSLKYRPAYLSNANSNYHLAVVGLVRDNANTGTSTLAGGIDKVSVLRYYKVDVGLIPRNGTVPSDFYLVAGGIGYYEDDGVAAGNTNLRMAFSFDDRTTWTADGPSTHTTALSSTPTQFTSDVNATGRQLALNSTFYMALGRVAGTTENTLGETVGVNDDINASVNFTLSQNYPNPFNPSTLIRYSIAENSIVTIKVYDAIGKEVATVVNEQKPTGVYEINFNASGLSNGVYFYRLKAGNFQSVRKMIVLK